MDSSTEGLVFGSSLYIHTVTGRNSSATQQSLGVKEQNKDASKIDVKSGRSKGKAEFSSPATAQMPVVHVFMQLQRFPSLDSEVLLTRASQTRPSGDSG